MCDEQNLVRKAKLYVNLNSHFFFLRKKIGILTPVKHYGILIIFKENFALLLYLYYIYFVLDCYHGYSSIF